MLSFLAASGAYRDDVQNLALLLVILAAWRWGAGPERVNAASVSLLWLLDFPRAWLFGDATYHRVVDPGLATIDTTAAIAFLAIALYANRVYPLWLAAFQLISAASHLMRWLDPAMNGIAYGIISIAPSWALLVTLAIGIWSHHRREARHGPYRSWRISSRLLQAIDPKGYPRD